MKSEDASMFKHPDSQGSDLGSENEWLELRRELVGSEISQLERLKERLDDPGVRASEVSRVLPNAIAISSVEDDKVARALQPTIDQSIKLSVAKNPQALADAIFPALGPGIRKAIRAIITGMIQSLNTILNQSFSLRGLKWRLEALRTRTSFAEVLLLHTLVYQVEQIFLIHRSTGIVLQHVEESGVGSQDPDLVSGMLTAIQDFMNDSFQTDNDEIETLRMGKDRSVWVEQGPDAIIAAVIRGRPPLDLRRQFREMVEIVHLQYRKYLDAFDGDVTPFSVTKDLLEDGIKLQMKEDSTKIISPVFLLLLGTIVTAIIIWAFTAYRQHSKFGGFVQKLKAEPGIVVLQTGRQDGRHVLFGLRDPLARDVSLIADEADVNPMNIIQKWESYYALHPALVAARAQKWLAPPDTVQFNVKSDTLFVTGAAPHEWIDRFRARTLFVPGVKDYNETGLKDVDLEAMKQAIADLSAVKMYFDYGKADIREENIELLENTVKQINLLKTIGSRLGESLQVVILGYTDSSGAENFNKRLSQERALSVMQYLLNQGIGSDLLSAEGRSASPPKKAAEIKAAPELDRVVTLSVLQQKDIR